MFFVAIRVQFEGVRIGNAFVEDDFVSFGFFDGLQCLGVCVPFDLVWIVHLGFSLSCSVGLVTLLMMFCFSRSKFNCSCLQGKTAYLAIDCTVFDSVPIIIGS